MNQTLHLDPREELPVLLGRIADCPEESVQLVLPDRSIAGQSLINLKLLQDEAGRLGKKLIVVSDQPSVQALAKRAGLAVAGDEALAQEHGFRQGQDIGLGPLPANPVPAGESSTNQKKPKTKADSSAEAGQRVGLPVSRHIPFRWLIVGVIAVLLLAGVGGLIVVANYIPKATVVLYTQERTISRDFTVKADPNATAVDAKNLVVPATPVSVEDSKTQSFSTSGKKI